jgi:Dolichyl-phosphate-mannose-protein mannosyltransferase
LTRVVLGVVLVLAAVVRLGGLDQGIRHGAPAGDEEHNFVTPIREMWARPTADPGVRPGYPGFFNDLAFLPVGLGERWGGFAGAYVGGRALVAAFSVLNVLLVFRLCESLAGTWPALFAAALMALSRGEIVHSHFITPDLVVISGVLLALLLLRRAPLTPRAAVLVGIVCGLTVATKYTGIVVLPALVLALARAELPPRRILLALAAALAAFAAAAPFTFLPTSSGSGMGLATVVRDYYSPTGYAATSARDAGYSGPAMAAELGAGYLLQDVGIMGAALALAAVALFRPRRGLAPGLAALATALAAVVPARLVFPRHVLVASALVIVLAGCGLRVLHDRLRPARKHLRIAIVAAVASLALLPAARTALALSARFRGPDGLDQAASWIEKTVPGQPLVATAYPRFAVADRFEVRYWSAPAEIALDEVPPLVVRHYDLVVAPASELASLAAQGLAVHATRTFDDQSGAVTAVALLEPASGTRVQATDWDASDNASAAPGPWRGGASWSSAQAEGWLSGRWDLPRRVVRVDVVADAAVPFTPAGVVLEGQSAGPRWHRLRAWALRPRTLSQQNPALPHGQAFVLDPPAVLTGLRVVGRGRGPWGLARIEVFTDPVPDQPATILHLPWAGAR